MSLWSDFLDNLKGITSAIGGAVTSPLLKAGTQIGAGTVSKGYDPTTQAIAGVAAAKGAKKSLEKAGVQFQDAGPLKPIDPVLQVASAAEKHVFSPYIKRPLSTGLLLTDPNSRLYKSKKLGKGFQLSDIPKAYERSADVSLGVAFTKSWVAGMSPIGQFEKSALSGFGGIDLENVDLWNDKDVQKNFVDNPVGRFISGTNDFIIGETAINFAFLGAGAITKAAAKAAGLSTRFRVGDFDAVKEFNNRIDEFLKYRRSGGQEGTYYNVGEDIQKMADSDNFIEINTKAKKYTYNREAIDLIVETKNPELVRDYLLMDKGDFGAYQRLVNSGNADDVWAISKARNEIINDYMTNGAVRTYTPEQRARWMQAHDDAIKKDPYLERVFNAFFDRTTDDLGNISQVNPKFLSTNYKPAEPIIGREFLGAIRSKKDAAKAAAIQRDFSNYGGIAKTVLASKAGGPITVLMRTVGTQMPNGFVSHSTLRPRQAIDELISVFDDIPLFSKGDTVITTKSMEKMTVSEYRNNILREFVGLKNDGQRELFVKNLNKELTYTIAHTRNFFDTEIIDDFIKSLENDIYSVHKDLASTGYAMSPNGVRIATDAKTMQMLSNSTAMLPFGRLDSMLARAARKEKSLFLGRGQQTLGLAGQGIRNIFELGNKAFSVAQLYRFSYIPKNSIFEPMLSGFLAEGTEFAVKASTTLAGRSVATFTNSLGKSFAKVKTTLPGNAIREVNKEISALNKQLSQAVAYRDQRYSEYHKYFVNKDGVSQKTKGRYADEIRQELKEAEDIIDQLESQLNVYTVETYSKNIKGLLEIPSIYTLRRRIDTLKKTDSVRYGSEIRAAEIALGKAVGEMNTLAPDLLRIDKEIANSYATIGKILDDIKPGLKKEAELLSISEGKYIKEPSVPKMKTFRTADGKLIEFPAFGDRNYFGEGYLSEIANTSDRTIEILGNKLSVGRLRGAIRNNSDKITKPTEPTYFAELEFIVNNRMRGDEIVDKILAGADRATLIAWSKTSAGRKYVIARGFEPDDAIDMIDDSIRYVNSMLPTDAVKALALKAPVKQLDLQKELADKLDQLLPIQPLEIPYEKPNIIAGVGQKIDAALARPWRWLLKPENIMRSVYGDVKHARIVIEKARALEASGQQVTFETLMSLRQSSAIELVDGLRKTFYTIPRQHRALYMSRLVTVFPNATMSGFYRYTGFALRQPRRTAGFLNAYYSLYNSYSVDKYGNPVEDPLEAEYLLVPGTKELGFNEGRGIILSTRATNFLANLPGANWLVPIPMAVVYANKPDASDTVRKVVDKYLGKIPGFSYDDLFPFGIQPPINQITSAMTPSWARDLYTAFKADDDNLAWRNSLENEAQRLNILADMGLREYPTRKEIIDGAKSLYYRKAFNKFFSIFGSPQVLGQFGVGLYEDYYQMLIEINRAKAEAIEDPQERTKALNKVIEKSEKQFQAQMRVSDTVDFKMDRLFVSVREKAAYFQPSTAAYNRIYKEFSGLASYLENNIAPDTVALLTADLPYEYNPQVAKFLNDPNRRLPGGDLLNKEIKDRTDIENGIEISRFWNAYTAKVKEINEAARQAGYTSYRSIEEAVADKDKFVEDLASQSPLWYNEYKKNASSGNKAYTWAKAIRTIIEPKKDGSPNRFMKKYGNSYFWSQAKDFSEVRDFYVKMYKDAPTGYKTQVQEIWQRRLDETLDLWDPALQKIITRYFLNDTLEATDK
jgi:hypothetical protein